MAAADDSKLSFEPIRSARAFEDIESQIRARISAGDLKPGDRLPAERELAAEFSVSRNTLREALRVLEIVGLLELRQGSLGGAFVRPGNPGVIVNSLRDLFQSGSITPRELTDARIWIGGTVVRVACERAKAEDLDALEANIEASAQAHAEGDLARRTAVNLEFHSLLGKATHNTLMAIMMDGIMAITREFFARLGRQADPDVLPSRRKLLRHMRKGEADLAAEEMTRHLTRIHRLYLSRLEEERRGAAG